jgi:cytochrome P450
MAEHRQSADSPKDMLTMLLDARDSEGDGGMMSDEQIRDEALTVFLAGHETTAIALAWTWYLLSCHKDAEGKLHREIDEVCGQRTPGISDIHKLTYTRMVFTESLRCYPPAWLISRMAVEDHRVDGHLIRRGTHVFVSPYLLHHDPRFFPEPTRFKPERWEHNAAQSQTPFTFIPFGAGPRNCIGESFAWMEGILILATIAQHWQFRLVNDYPIELEPRITLRPKHGIKVIAEAR